MTVPPVESLSAGSALATAIVPATLNSILSVGSATLLT